MVLCSGGIEIYGVWNVGRTRDVQIDFSTELLDSVVSESRLSGNRRGGVTLM